MQNIIYYLSNLQMYDNNILYVIIITSKGNTFYIVIKEASIYTESNRMQKWSESIK